MICQGPPVFITCFKQRYWMWGATGLNKMILNLDFTNVLLGCTFYAFTGAFTGVAAIMSMVMIGYDRYNIIVKVRFLLIWPFWNFLVKTLFLGDYRSKDYYWQSYDDDCHLLYLCLGSHNWTSVRLGRLQTWRISYHLHLWFLHSCKEYILNNFCEDSQLL